ncbi:MAG: glycosyltransferase [Lachnospiraceae bacterium]|nr:glycosyltransferase [Lachnospiraceae bacterium]
MQGKKILIACNYFAPDNTIAAVRLTKIARYLHLQGYKVTILAEKKYSEIKDEILERDAEGIEVIWIENSCKGKNIVSMYKKIMTPIKNKRYDNLDNRIKINRKTGKYEFFPFEVAYPVIGSLDYLVELLRQYDLAKMARKQLEGHWEQNFLFTSYGGLFGYFIGKYIHKKNKSIIWIFDIRDSICRYKFTPKYVRWIAKNQERYVWREADCITAVSKGICERVSHKYRHKAYCVTNGYDKRDRLGIHVKERINGKLRFAYTGGMYGGLQDLSSFFCNIRVLIDENVIDVDRVEFLYAGKQSAYEVFRAQAKKYELENNCVYCGMLTRKDSLQLQMESDVLLVSSFDYQTEVGGVITGKALEYMSANKPIIAIINGDIEHSELAEIIRSGNLGCAYEESHAETDTKELYEYLKGKYKEFIGKGRLEHNPNEEVLLKFDYEYIGNNLLTIIESLDRDN